MSKFYVPKTLQADFDQFLTRDVPDQVMSVQIVKDWYARQADNYVPKYVRIQMYPDNAKSRYVNTDNMYNVRFSKADQIQVGDYIIKGDRVFVLDWLVSPMSNNKPSRAMFCNSRLTFSREQQAVVSGRTITQKAGTHIIAESIPANVYRYDGRPQFSAASALPGVSANAQTIAVFQYNQKTADLKVWDEFVWGPDVYSICDIDYTNMNPSLNDGLLRIQAKKKAGGGT